MNTIIDLIGSMFIETTIILIITNLNIQMMIATQEQIKSNGSQYLALGMTSTMEFDLYKVGYRVSGTEKITTADSTSFKFYADIDNNSSVDSVYYYLSSRPFNTSTGEYALYRKVNTENPMIISYTKEFKFTYFDSLGTKLTYTSLAAPAKRNEIATINVTSITRSEAGLGSDYQSTEWTKKFRPKNL
ncbi:MAG: hypothetical protein HUU54_12445 [Ignavibacteriaceae bacterium]|nr:hypothetical protein [Ignavibacteriaceae bacterium]